MRNFIIILALVALLPISMVGGYMLNGDPAPKPIPTLRQHMLLTMKGDVQNPQTQWLYVVTKGDLRGQTTDAEVVAQLPAADLKGYPGRYVVRSCSFYSTSGSHKALFDREIAAYCTERFVTKAQVLERVKSTS